MVWGSLKISTIYLKLPVIKKYHFIQSIIKKEERQCFSLMKQSIHFIYGEGPLSERDVHCLCVTVYLDLNNENYNGNL